jgi:hypothetical protein
MRGVSGARSTYSDAVANADGAMRRSRADARFHGAKGASVGATNGT